MERPIGGWRGGGVKREKKEDIGRYVMVSGDREIIQIRRGV